MEKSFSEMSPLALAFLGDGVYELLVRDYILRSGSAPVSKLHSQAVNWVRCEAQAKALKDIEESLSEEELDFVRRGRNAHVSHVPKNSAPEDYHFATALETLFGALYLKGEFSRIHELFGLIVKKKSSEEGKDRD